MNTKPKMKRTNRWLMMATLAIIGAATYPIAALCDDAPDVAASGRTFMLSDRILRLSNDSTDSLPYRIAVIKSNGEATIELQSPKGADHPIVIPGGLELARYVTLNITGAAACQLNLPKVTSNDSGSVVRPAGPATVTIAAMTGDIHLDGSSTGNQLGLYEGNSLQKQGTGSWTITGDNSHATWNTAITAGKLVVAKNASLGSGDIHVDSAGTFAPAAGAGVAGTVRMSNDSTLDLADGTIGEVTFTGNFAGAGGGTVKFRFDLDKTGVDHLILGGVTNANDIKDLVEFNILGDSLTPGVYPLVTNTRPELNMMENHFGFDFHGDPADHRNIVRVKRVIVGKTAYQLTLCSPEDVNRDQKVTLTIE